MNTHTPAVAEGPYTHRQTNIGRLVYDGDGRALASVYTPMEGATSLAEADATAEAQAALFAAAPDLLAACEAVVYSLERIATGQHVAPVSAAALLDEVRTALAKTRNLLDSEALQAQPQCVRGERLMDGSTYLCNGALEEQKGSGE